MQNLAKHYSNEENSYYYNVDYNANNWRRTKGNF